MIQVSRSVHSVSFRTALEVAAILIFAARAFAASTPTELYIARATASGAPSAQSAVVEAGDVMLPPALTAAEEQKVLVTLPALDTNRLRQEDEAAAASDKSAPFRIGVVRPASIVVSERGLARQDMAPGQQLRTVVIESPGAFGIRLCVSAGQGAAGLGDAWIESLSVASAAASPAGRKGIYIPAQSQLSGQAQGDSPVWLPAVPGSRLAFTAAVGASSGDASTSPAGPVIVGVAHIYRRFDPLLAGLDADTVAAIIKAAPSEYAIASVDCPSLQRDVTCYSDWATEALGVATYDFISGGTAYICSGCLLADSDSSTQIPYFLTANHCLGTQTEATSAEFYWFYQTPTCNGTAPSLSSVPKTTGGGTIVQTTSSYDSTLLRLNTAPPSGVAFVGWTTDVPASGASIVGIHHPSGDYKRISFGSVTNSSASSNTEIQVKWSNGVTEGGSSGSPLFYARTKRIIGALSGGDDCLQVGQNVTDYYGKFQRFYSVYSTVQNALGTGIVPPQLILVSASANCGETADVVVRVEGATSLDSFGFTLTYNVASLKYAGYSRGAATSNWEAVAASESTLGQVVIGGYRGTGTLINGTGELVHVSLQCNAASCPSESAVSASSLVDGLAGGTVTPATVQCKLTTPNQAPSRPVSQPVMHIKLGTPSVDPEGGTVTYRYVWTSSGTNDPAQIVHQKTAVEDTLTGGSEGATFDVGETWTVTVTPIDPLGLAGESCSGTFVIESAGIRFLGWGLY